MELVIIQLIISKLKYVLIETILSWFEERYSSLLVDFLQSVNVLSIE